MHRSPTVKWIAGILLVGFTGTAGDMIETCSCPIKFGESGLLINSGISFIILQGFNSSNDCCSSIKPLVEGRCNYMPLGDWRSSINRISRYIIVGLIGTAGEIIETCSCPIKFGGRLRFGSVKQSSKNIC